MLQVIFLIRYVNNTNYSLVKFLDALKNEDFSVYFSPSKKGDSFAKVFADQTGCKVEVDQDMIFIFLF